MANAQELIGKVTLQATQTVVTFANLPQNYRDLVLVIQGNQASNTGCSITYNGDVGSNYTWVRIYGDGSSAVCTSNFSSTSAYAGDIGPGQTSMIFSINNYSDSDKHKTLISRANMPANYLFLTSSRWANTTPINTLTLTGSAAFSVGFTFTLYGVLA